MSPTTSSKKYKTIKNILKRAKHVNYQDIYTTHDHDNDDNDDHDHDDDEDDDVYGNLMCSECGKGENEDELMLCDGCDKGFHIFCARPIVPRVPVGKWFCSSCCQPAAIVRRFPQKKIIDFFKIRKCAKRPGNCPSSQEARKRRRRSSVLVVQKKRRRLMQFTPTEDHARRLVQMGSLAHALTASKMKFSDELTYREGMAPQSANQAEKENGGMQVLSTEDFETLEQCKAMCKRGECPPLLVVYDSCQGFTVEADDPIKDMTFIAEYSGDVDYSKNRENDDCDSMMSLLLTTDPADSLVVCPDRRGNIARFISGINNHSPESKKKQNLKCVRYNINGECRVILIATRDIAKGERLYYDYNGYKQEYPTHHFV